MNLHHNQNHTKEQICVVLKTIKDCIHKDHYIISKNENRQENIDFIKEYNLITKKQKNILMKIGPEDFCHTLQNTNSGFEHEVLYVFCPQVMLYTFDEGKELVDIYIKFNIINVTLGNRVVVISFHKRNKPIDYLFRRV